MRILWIRRTIIWLSTLPKPFRRAWTAFERLPRPQPIRLIGLSVSGLIRAKEPWQLGLFDRSVRTERLGRLTDELRARFGPNAVRRASLPAREPP